MFVVYPYSMASRSAKLVADALNCKRININGTTFRYRPYYCVLNWGSSRRTRYPISINLQEKVNNASHKGIAYHIFSNRGIPTVCTTSLESVAREWLEAGNHVYARKTLTGYGGRGIQVLHPRESVDWQMLRDVQLFSKRFPVHREFRIHIVQGKVIKALEKRKRRDTTPDPYVRNHANNWVFCQYDLAPYPEAVLEQSINAVQALGLNFGAVDIALNRDQEVCVFEVNTAPGVDTTTARSYAEAFKRHWT